MPSAVARPSLDRARRQFDQWRASRTRGTRIPAELWTSAVVAARQHGVATTSYVLRLAPDSLRQRLDVASVNEAPDGMVEISLPSIPGSDAECVVEIADAGGRRLRVELRGAAATRVDAVVSRLWETAR